MKLRNALSALFLAVMAASICSAQFTLRGSISGIVTDASHALVPPQASRSSTSIATDNANTNGTGLFTFTELTIRPLPIYGGAGGVSNLQVARDFPCHRRSCAG